jgi:hypothetical protein
VEESLFIDASYLGTLLDLLLLFKFLKIQLVLLTLDSTLLQVDLMRHFLAVSLHKLGAEECEFYVKCHDVFSFLEFKFRFYG